MLNIVHDDSRVYIMGYVDGIDSRFYLHSDGQMLTTPEYWPTRAGAEAILAKYPDVAPPVVSPPPHVWVHGDVFMARSRVEMVYFNPTAPSRNPQVQFLDANFSVSRINDVDHYLKGAKFLFNINDVASDAVKERQASHDAESTRIWRSRIKQETNDESIQSRNPNN